MNIQKLLIIGLVTLLMICRPAVSQGGTMEITSLEFMNFQSIPKKFTCQGKDNNPPLVIKDAPQDTKSFALIVDDPDAPGKTWVHWVVFNIPPTVTKIRENSVPGRQGGNDFEKRNYGGPCPPSGEHRYYFKLYALDTMLDLQEGITKAKLEEHMKGHILAEAQLVGKYRKSTGY